MIVVGWIGLIILTLVAFLQAILIVGHDERKERIVYLISLFMILPALIFLWWVLV
ncbi:MAG: hypothetical protein WDA59_07920 [Methanofastidiosum sp.]